MSTNAAYWTEYLKVEGLAAVGRREGQHSRPGCSDNIVGSNLHGGHVLDLRRCAGREQASACRVSVVRSELFPTGGVVEKDRIPDFLSPCRLHCLYCMALCLEGRRPIIRHHPCGGLARPNRHRPAWGLSESGAVCIHPLLPYVFSVQVSFLLAQRMTKVSNRGILHGQSNSFARSIPEACRDRGCR